MALRLVPPKRVLVLYQIRTVLVFLVLCAALLAFYSFSEWLLLPVAILLFICAIITFIFLPLYFKGYSITVCDDTVTVEKGVIIKVTHIMPFARMLYTSSYTTPLGRLFGVSGFTLKAARSRLMLLEFKKEDAEKLLSLISRGGK